MVFSACATFVTAFRFPLCFQLVQHLWQAWHLWQLWWIRIAWCFHAWRIRWTGLSQNSNGFPHVALSLSICLGAMWRIWMAWDVCPCAGSFGESELHGVSMLGALGGQVWVRILMVYSVFLCLWAFAWRPCGVFGWLGMFAPVLAAYVVYLEGLGCLTLCLNRWQTYKNIEFLRLHMFSTRWEWAALCQNSIVICIFLSLGGCRKPTKTCVFSAFLEAFGSGGFWPGSVLIYKRFFLNPGFSKTLPPSLPPKGLESELHGVFSLCNICDSFQVSIVFSTCPAFVTGLAFVAALVYQNCMVFPCLVH